VKFHKRYSKGITDGKQVFEGLLYVSWFDNLVKKNVLLNFFGRGDEHMSMFVKPISARVMAKNLELLVESIRTCNVLFFRNVKSICLAFDGWSTSEGGSRLLA
jgi:hypothetical protein